ncbi:MAG: hypothetical protein K9G41_04875 [Flavobacteriales bacterium]|nr:hypothetical protein [Flavobacteriales bacterium]
MSRIFLPLIVLQLLLLLGTDLRAQQDNSYKGDDLHYLGYVLLTGDTSAWTNVSNDDIYYLSKSLFMKNQERLKFIKNDDLYFFGLALITGKKEELDKIVKDDYYYLASAIFDKKESSLENIKSDDLYYLGKGLLTKDMNYFDQMSTIKAE